MYFGVSRLVDLPEYHIWRGMFRRCTASTNKDFKHYGGRGISIHPEWLDLRIFVEDVGRRPEGYTLERIENDKGYAPGNVKWIPASDQNLNKRNSHFVDYEGKKLTLSQFCTLPSAVNQYTLKSRIAMGWAPKDALTKPVRRIMR